MINQNSIFYWLRWILLIPFSFGLGLLASSIIELILFYIVGEPERFKNALDPLIVTSFSIIITYGIAPKYKLRAATLICILWILAILLRLYITITNIKIYDKEYLVMDHGVAIFMMISGVSLGYYVICKRKLIGIYK